MKNKTLTFFIITIFLLSAIALASMSFVSAISCPAQPAGSCISQTNCNILIQNNLRTRIGTETCLEPGKVCCIKEPGKGTTTAKGGTNLQNSLCIKLGTDFSCICTKKQCDKLIPSGDCVKGKCWGDYSSKYCCKSAKGDGKVDDGEEPATNTEIPTCSVSFDNPDKPTKIIVILLGNSNKIKWVVYRGILNVPLTINKPDKTQETKYISILENQDKGEMSYSFDQTGTYTIDSFLLTKFDTAKLGEIAINCPSASTNGIPGKPNPTAGPPKPNVLGRLKICFPGGKNPSDNNITPVECIFNYMAIAYGIYIGAVDLRNDVGKCSSEQPLKGLNDAEQRAACISCNIDPYRICTQARCQMLGNCLAVPTPKEDQYNCIQGQCIELGLTTFTQGKVETYIDENKSVDKPLTITAGNIRTDLAEIKWNTNSIFLNITTDKPAQCRWILDKTGAKFDEMSDFDDNYFPMVSGGQAGSQSIDILLPGEIIRNSEHMIFIKCKNVCGVEHEPSYDNNIVRFRLGAKPDQLPPEIVYVDPASNSVVRGDLKTINAQFWLDENGLPGKTCKYSDKTMNFTLDWDKMKWFEDKSNPTSTVIVGSCTQNQKCLNLNDPKCAHCALTLDLNKGYEDVNFSLLPPEVQQQMEEAGFSNVTKMFHLLIRCQDAQSNKMTEDDALDYFLMTMPPYNITILKPEKGSQTYDTSPDIEVTSEPRKTECRYRIFKQPSVINCYSPNIKELNWSIMRPIDDGFDVLHQGKHNETLAAGDYKICAKCRDQWNIEAIDTSDFKVLKDTKEPIVIRMYHGTETGDYLIIETDENATCVYGTSDTIGCKYNFTDGNSMTGTNETLHAGYWQLDNLYYIKCVDRWANYPGGSPIRDQCTITINPYEVPPL